MSGQEKKKWNLYELMEEKSEYVEKALASSGAKDAQKEAKALIHGAWQEVAWGTTHNRRVLSVGAAVFCAATAGLWLRDDPTVSADNAFISIWTLVFACMGMTEDSALYVPRAEKGHEPQRDELGNKRIYKNTQKKIVKKVAQRLNLG
jgi:hypothetical protein